MAGEKKYAVIDKMDSNQVKIFYHNDSMKGGMEEMQAYASKLIDLIESKAENIAKQWATDVMKHRQNALVSLSAERHGY